MGGEAKGRAMKGGREGGVSFSRGSRRTVDRERTVFFRKGLPVEAVLNPPDDGVRKPAECMPWCCQEKRETPETS